MNLGLCITPEQEEVILKAISLGDSPRVAAGLVGRDVRQWENHLAGSEHLQARARQAEAGFLSLMRERALKALDPTQAKVLLRVLASRDDQWREKSEIAHGATETIADIFKRVLTP